MPSSLQIKKCGADVVRSLRLPALSPALAVTREKAGLKRRTRMWSSQFWWIMRRDAAHAPVVSDRMVLECPPGREAGAPEFPIGYGQLVKVS